VFNSATFSSFLPVFAMNVLCAYISNFKRASYFWVRQEDSLKLKVARVDEAVACLRRHVGRGAVPRVLISALAVAAELVGYVHTPSLVSVHHVAAVKGFVSQFKRGVVEFFLSALLVDPILLVLRKLA